MTCNVDKSGARVREMFCGIAHRYDFLNHLLSLNQDVRWRKRAARVLGVRENQRVLDLCCGTGDLSFEISKRQPNCEIIGADFAFPMLQLGADKNLKTENLKTQNLKNKNPKWVCADALQLPFPNGYFDAATCAFGARNFENTQAGLRELQRVLKPEGKLLILEFMRPQSPVVQKGFSAFNMVLSPIGKWVSGHPTAYKYLPQSVGGFYTRNEFAQLLQRTGFQDVRKLEHGGGVATSFLARRNSA